MTRSPHIPFLFCSLLLAASVACTSERGRDSATDADAAAVASGVASDVDADTAADGIAEAASEIDVNSDATADPGVASPGTAAAATGDTARGMVRIVGSEPNTAAILDGPAGVVALGGPALTLLRRAVGAEVTVRGTLTNELDLMAAPNGARRFVVADFVVRTSDGNAVTDGVLELDNGSYSLRLANGERRPIIQLPDELKAHVGERIYIIGSVDRPSGWGILGKP